MKARGIDEVRGALVGDESRYDTVRGAPGWLPQHVPMFIGPLSALVVDRNQLRPDADYAANPLPGTLPYFRAALLRAGVRVPVPNRPAPRRPAAPCWPRWGRRPIGELVGEMLNQSDNLIAEILVKEVGYRAARPAYANAIAAAVDRPTPGSTAGGLAAIERRRPRPRRAAGGGGRRRLRAVPGGPPLGAGVAVAAPGGLRPARGPSGSSGRCRWPPATAPWPAASRRTAAEANVRAKTGWIDEAR